jgi:phosphopantetheinyl transferase
VDDARNKGCVHLWMIPVHYEWARLTPNAHWLDDRERQRAAELLFDRDRLLYVTAHLWLRRLLAAQLSIEPGEVHLVQSTFGKPAVSRRLTCSQERLHFSLSHTHSALLFGLTSDGEVGVDIEPVRPLGNLNLLSDAVLHPLEMHHVCAPGLPEEERLALFFRTWTAKEAYTKALGLGLAHPFRQLHVDLGEHSFALHDPSAQEAGFEAVGWSDLLSTDKQARYAVAASLLRQQASYVLHPISSSTALSDRLPAECGSAVRRQGQPLLCRSEG